MHAMTRRAPAAVSAILALLMSGCAYLGDRARDFCDIWKLQAELGGGLDVSVKLGDALHVGIGGHDAGFLGIAYEPACRRGHRIERNFPVALFGTECALHSEQTNILFAPERRNREREACWFVPAAGPGRHPDTRSALHVADIEAGVFVPVMPVVIVMGGLLGGAPDPKGWSPLEFCLGGVGLRAGFSPGELADFLLGLAGVDIAGDDGEGRECRRPRPVPTPAP